MPKVSKKEAKDNILIGSREDEKGGDKNAGFRDKKRVKAGVVNYLFKPKDNQAYNFSELEVVKEWPARRKQLVKVHPVGSPLYDPGSTVHFNLVVPSHCFMRFTAETLCAIVGMVMNAVPVPGQQPRTVRLMPLREENKDDEEDFDATMDPDEERNFVEEEKFIPESPSGIALSLVDRIEVMVHNTVVKCFEISGSALQRYHGLANRTAKEGFGPDMDATSIGYYLPETDKDIDSLKPSKKLLEYAREFRKDKNERFATRSSLYGFPFLYDPVIRQIHNKEDLESYEFGPGTHLELRIFLSGNFSRGLRSLDAETPTLTVEERSMLWNRKPRFALDQMWLTMERQMFPVLSQFLKQMDAEFAKRGSRPYPFCAPNDLRNPVTPNLTEQTWPINLHLIGYPTLLYVYFERSDNIDGINGANVNTTVYKFPPNLDSIDITYQETSLLPGGELRKLDLPELDTHDKMYFFDDQKRFRRHPGTYETFFDDGVQQYILIELTDLYLQDAKLSELDALKVSLKFNNRLSPEGWQIGLMPVNEKMFELKPTGEHIITNSAGKQQIQA